MAEIKKYVSLDKLTKYDAKIKGVISAGDEATLAAAKAHAESLGTQYDAAGAAATVQGELDKEIARAKAAEEAALKAGQDAQGEVDALELVVAEKAAAADLAALAGKVGDVPADQTVMGIIENIQENAYDDTEITQAIAGLEANKADKTQVATDIGAVKTELEGKISTAQTKADGADAKVTTLIGEDANKSVRTIANEELVAQIIPEAAKESLDTLAEIAAWIQSHPDDASAMSKAIDDLEALVGTLPEGVDQTNVVAYVQALVAAETAAREGVVSGLDERLQAVEGAVGESGSVADDIATAKQEAIDAAAGDATTKANKALEDAKKYADEEDAKIELRVDALEAIDHEHANKALLDTYTQTEADLADAVAKKHEHANKEALDTVTAAKITAWEAAEANAKAYADAEVAKDRTRLDAVEAWQTNMIEVSEAEINALFGEAQA